MTLYQFKPNYIYGLLPFIQAIFLSIFENLFVTQQVQRIIIFEKKKNIEICIAATNHNLIKSLGFNKKGNKSLFRRLISFFVAETIINRKGTENQIYTFDQQQKLIQNLLILIKSMGNNICTSSQDFQDQNEISIHSDNGDSILQMNYKQQQGKNTLNTKKQLLREAKCFSHLQISKSLNFSLDIKRTDFNSVNGKRNIDLNDNQTATKQQNGQLEPIVFSLTNFSIDSFREISSPEEKNTSSHKRIDNRLSSTCDQEDNLNIIGSASTELDLDLLVNQQITIKKQQFIRVKKQSIQKDYIYKEKLGEGSFGQVYKCQNIHTREIRAVKVLKKNILLNPKVKEQFMHEFTLLKKIDHPNIIKVFQIYQMSQSMCIVSQFCRGHTLSYYLKKKIQFGQQTKKQILRQVLLGVNYLHHMNIIHRDLKPDNIVFINAMTQQTQPEDVDLRIIDLGLAVQEEKAFKDWANIGTFNFMAPEAFNGLYSNKCDSWSCGIIAYLLLLGSSPFKGLDLQEVKQKISVYSPNLIDFKNLKPQAIELLLNLTKVNYILRWKVNQALNSKYFFREQQNQIKNIILKKFPKYERRNILVVAAQSYLSLQKGSKKEHRQISKYFHAINSNQNGLITLQELKRYFSHLEAQKVERMFMGVDKNRSGNIDFGEFIAAMTNKKDLFSQGNIKELFDFIDINRNGQISIQQMRLFLQTIDKSLVGQLIHQISKDKKAVTFQQFLSYFQTLKQL